MRLKQKKTIDKNSGNLLLLIGVLLLLTGWISLKVLGDLPNPRRLTSQDYPESSRIFDRNGELLYEIYDDKRRVAVKLADIPNELVKATLAIEDNNFYRHGGFDLRGIVRGVYRTLFQKRLQGGSTITQQLVKNALLTQERTMTRKVKEAILTIATEFLYSKDQILEMYFNQTPYGGTMWGVEAAARGIFNKPVGELNLAQAALIAGLPGSPTKYYPFAHPDAAKNRQELVLSRMRDLGYISQERKNAAEKEVLDYYVNRNEIGAPHFVFYIKEQLVDKYGLRKVNEGGLRVVTTLDRQLQDYVQNEVASEVGRLNKYRVYNGAAMVTDARTGQILAMVGSKDYFATDIEGKFNVATAMRQPGSAIKPLNYAVALELGKITAASIINDGPNCFSVENQRDYCPTNYGNKYYGVQNARNSLANSLNIPAVKVLKLNGIEAFVASASAMGITTFKNASDYGLSLTLGGGEVKMVDMMVAFGTLANMGVRQSLNSTLKIEDKATKILEEYGYIPGDRVLSRETAFIIQQILADDGARAMVFGRGSMLNIKGHPEVAVKTGTTNDLRDNWTMGYTPDYVVGVWVGNNDNSRMGGLVSGTTGAAPIWNRIMTQLLKDRPVKNPTTPSGVVGTYVCNLTGELPPTEGCETHYEYFKKDSVPNKTTSLKTNVLIDKDTGQPVKEGENKTNIEWQEHLVIKDVAGELVCLDCPLIGEQRIVNYLR